MIFLNYRSRDEAYAAALLDQELSKSFGPHRIFRASRSILPGDDYEQSILRAIECSDVMLVLVGPNWLSADTAKASSREDWVKREIVESYKQEVITIPILLSGASRLTEEELPAEIARLGRSQYLRFDYRNFVQDSTLIAAELVRSAPALGRENAIRRLRNARSVWRAGRTLGL